MINEIFSSISHNLGKTVGSALSGAGMATDDAGAVAVAVPALLGFGLDLLVAFMRKRRGRAG